VFYQKITSTAQLTRQAFNPTCKFSLDLSMNLEHSITPIAISVDDTEEVTVLPLCISDLSLHLPCALRELQGTRDVIVIVTSAGELPECRLIGDCVSMLNVRCAGYYSYFNEWGQ
jgi:hypothetical protein